MEQGVNLLQRDADESERDDLLQNFEVVFVIGAIPRCAALGREQADPVIVMQRTYRVSDNSIGGSASGPNRPRRMMRNGTSRTPTTPYPPSTRAIVQNSRSPPLIVDTSAIQCGATSATDVM